MLVTLLFVRCYVEVNSEKALGQFAVAKQEFKMSELPLPIEMINFSWLFKGLYLL